MPRKFEAMHSARPATALAVMLICVSLAATADEQPAKPAEPAESAVPLKAAEAEPEAENIPEFKPPPGFRTQKRGDTVLYCRKEAVLGSRFPAEKCYDQTGIRDLERLELERTEKLQQMRACSKGSCTIG